MNDRQGTTQRRRTTMLSGLALALLFLLAACGSPGVSNEDAEEMRDTLAGVQDRLDEIEDTVAELEEDDVDAQAVAEAVREALADARDTTESVREDLEPPEPEPLPEDGGGGGALDPAAPATP